MIVKAFSYSKAEKLKSRKLLNKLFKEGKSLNAFPLKLIYLWNETSKDLSESNSQVSTIVVGVGVSARNFKKAVDRNRIKRLLRESYRVQKQLLVGLNAHEKQWQVFFIYTGKELPETSVIQSKMQILMTKLVEQCGRAF